MSQILNDLSNKLSRHQVSVEFRKKASAKRKEDLEATFLYRSLLHYAYTVHAKEEVARLKPKSACPKHFKQQQRNKTRIKCALCPAQSGDTRD